MQNTSTFSERTEPPAGERTRMLADVAAMQEAVKELPDRDCRSPEEIIGYDDFGLPG